MKDPREYLLEKNLMIRASAGSGKTYQLSNRIIGYVGGRDVDPTRLVALTFTRKAAGEFADAILSKLAEAADDTETAARLGREIGVGIDATATLKRVVEALPQLQLGTMDSFFARVVRRFQYELGITGGSFELIQGPRRDQAVNDILGSMLGNAIAGEQAEEFLHAFKRATMGKGDKNVVAALNGFIGSWTRYVREGRGCEPGQFFDDPAGLPDAAAWEAAKHPLVAKLRKATESVEWTDKRQTKAWEKFCTALEAHTIGSGTAKEGGKLFETISDWAADPTQPLLTSLYKPFDLGPMAAQVLGEIFALLAQAELHQAVARSKATLELVARFDFQCERRLRRRGLLGFDDIKHLMGQWAVSEDARLRREAVDFRLDARYDHWLLDEFQDTSGEEWRGMSPLLDEAVSDPEGSVFIVGDKKQAIYGWRGGDVKLFDRVQSHYGDGLLVEAMPLSWRSGRDVLDLVNRICGDRDTLARTFGEGVAARWQWENHEPAKPNLAGEVRVEVIEGKEEARRDRLIELLGELGIGEKELTCGILTRTNKQTREISDRLRAEGFDVIEEGARHPTEDHPVGVALAQLVAWLADPRDTFARRIVAMSPLETRLTARFGGIDTRAWDRLNAEAAATGFAAMLEALIEPLWDDLGAFGRRRAEDVIGALGGFDGSGGSGARQAKRWIHDLQIPQSPGTAAVQVMTTHKAKGLGFDVVILPELEDTKVPSLSDYHVATGPGWALQNPAGWVRGCFPALAEAEAEWAEDQCYEAMCVLYVALTRAKRGLYLLLPAPSKNAGNEPKSSPVGLIRETLGITDTGLVHQSGDRAWLDALPPRQDTAPTAVPALQPPRPRRRRATPSGAKTQAAAIAAAARPTDGGQRFGTEVHHALEAVGWIDDEPPEPARNEAGQVVAQLLREPAIRPHFERRGRDARLLREQPFEVILDGQWVSGVIDRLHLIDGAKRLEIIDFKTDAVADETTLVERYRGQMDIYRRAMAQIFPDAAIVCLLLSTRLKRGVEVA
jgi:ATP-dependent exoDNAse (exonuclease V) beta subunit